MPANDNMTKVSRLANNTAISSNRPWVRRMAISGHLTTNHSAEKLSIKLPICAVSPNDAVMSLPNSWLQIKTFPLVRQ